MAKKRAAAAAGKKAKAKAKAKPKAKAKAVETAAAKPSEVKAVIATKTFTTLVKDVRSADADIHDSQTAKSGLIKAAQKSGLHKEAFATFQKLARKSDKALGDFLTHFEHYLEIGGLNMRVKAQGELLDKTPKLSEGEIDQVAGTGGRKRKKAAAPAQTFDSQSEREGAAQFGEGVAGEAEGNGAAMH